MKNREPLFVSCTPLGVFTLIDSIIPTVSGMNVTILGRSNIVGMPLSLLFNKRDATVTLCHQHTKDVEACIRNADIVVSAIGRPEFIKGEWFKEGAIAIDVGINYLQDSQGKSVIVGDIEFDKAIERCGYITPVPGGVGPMTIAMLMSNVIKSWERMNFN
jgi:5,10-methylene-tetrahydrofolate dehydrogenase/methenyl tetrahydrofolate cyclohydrolase